jgi:hypothetical protein
MVLRSVPAQDAMLVDIEHRIVWPVRPVGLLR